MISKTIIKSVILVCILLLVYILYNIKHCDNFENVNQNKSLVSVMDFTKQAIKGEKGDLGLHMLEKNGQLHLGGLDRGFSGKNKNNQMQLYLGGKHNEGSNNGRKGQTSYKLMIDGYDNDGSIVYPIMCKDEDKNIDFYVKNRQSSGQKPLIYSGGDLVVNGDIKSGKTNILHHLMPKGSIIAFNSSTKIPYGWTICDGRNGSPNLTGRFIMGASQSRKLNTKGGLERVKLSLNQMPKHSHAMNYSGRHNHTANISRAGRHNHYATQYHANFKHKGRATEGSTKNDGDGSFKQYSSMSGDHSHSISIHNSGQHKHSLNYSGSNHSHENMPPYYALIYIMKII